MRGFEESILEEKTTLIIYSEIPIQKATSIYVGKRGRKKNNEPIHNCIIVRFAFLLSTPIHTDSPFQNNIPLDCYYVYLKILFNTPFIKININKDFLKYT